MKTVMKRLFSLMLVAVLLVSAVPTAFADTTYKVSVVFSGNVSGGMTVDVTPADTVNSVYSWVANAKAIDTSKYTASFHWTGAVYTGNIADPNTNIGEDGTLEVKMICTHSNKVADTAKAPTCTENGLTAGEHCGDCGAVLTAQTIVPYTGHTPVVDAAVAPTCTNTGLSEGKHCSVCGAVETAQTTVAALGHTWVAASCNDPKTCSVCGAVDGENNGHTWVLQSETAPTCTEAGKKEYKCGVCGVPKTETIPYLGHNIGSEGKCLREGCSYTENTRYAVEFYKNYNENNDPVTKFVAKGTKVYSIYTPYRDGYSFEGWYTVSGSRVSESATVTGDSAYFAKWTQNAPHEVYVKFYTHGNTKNVVKYVDMHHYAHDGVISLDDLMTVAKKNFKARGNESLYIQGPFTSSEWDIFCDNSAYRNTSEKIEVSQTSTTVIHAMVRNVDDSKTSSSSSKADSSNPKTGDMIFAPVAVMGLSVSALAVLFYLNKKRAY